ncbi:hypothetical protein MCOR02_000719 [Pyricularia oryzae]|nr:hypothetical protein MCOR02_000719 [Pyricularia oryzae]KAI6325118.1 Type I Iterative PKS [Pyricularia oryzae]
MSTAEGQGAAPTGSPSCQGAIAVVGLACRFPGDAADINGLWQMMEDGKSAWTKIPESRMNVRGYYHPDPSRQGSFHFRGAHFLQNDLAEFDAGASDDEDVTFMACLSDHSFHFVAGIPKEAIDGTDATVWIGSFVKDYEQLCLRDQDQTPQYAATGNGIAILGNRISHCYNLAGTSQTMDTGCSASLVSIHQACQSLLSGECSTAIAGGVGLILTPNTILPMTSVGFLSSDGRCFAFDSRANGYGRGEGAAMVILRRLEDAIANNDVIRGVIRSTASNQDGRTPGITMPSQERQMSNILQAYRKAGLDTDRTEFVECHGTGTKAGDVRELEAIYRAISVNRAVDNPVMVGSIKTNIGHLEGAAGIAGVIKAVLATEKGFIPKHLNFVQPNPNIDFEGWRVKVPTELTPWPVHGLRRASVNCFGFGGTNAHAIIEDAAHHLSEANLTGFHASYLFPGDELLQPRKSDANSQDCLVDGDAPRLFVYSSHEEERVSLVAQSHAPYLRRRVEDGSATLQLMDQYAHTLLERRSKLEWRAFLVARGPADLLQKIFNFDNSLVMDFPRDAEVRPALVFCGQGAQWHAMARELLDYAVFNSSIEAADSYIRQELGAEFSLLEVLTADQDSSRIDLAHVSQISTTAVQVALVDVLFASNVVPIAVVGHSSGEIAAAYAAGAVTRESAWKIAYYRGYCVASWQEKDHGPPGRMLAVGLSARDVQAFIHQTSKGSVQVACHNGPSSVTLSGDEAAILEVQNILAEAGVFSRLVPVNAAYHSRHMEHVAADYLQKLSSIEIRDVTLGPVLYSSLTGSELSPSRLGAKHWVKTLTCPVLFHQAVQTLMRNANPTVVVEVSPTGIWEGTIRRILSAMDYREPVPYFSVLQNGTGAMTSTLQVLRELWIRGVPIKMDWTYSKSRSQSQPESQSWQNGLVQTSRPPQHLHDLPPYPWNHDKLYWYESQLSKNNRFRTHGREDLIGAPFDLGIKTEKSWRGFFRLKENPWIEHHQVQKSILYPAAGMIAMAIQAGQQLAELGRQEVVAFEIKSFSILAPIVIPTSTDGLEHAISTKLAKSESSEPLQGVAIYHFSIYTKPDGVATTKHAEGQLHIIYGDVASSTLEEMQIEDSAHRSVYDQYKEISDEEVSPRQLYEDLNNLGLNYGPLFRNIKNISRSSQHGGYCHSQVQIPDTASAMPFAYEFPHLIHPATLDSFLQTIFAIGEDVMLPCSIDNIFVSAEMPRGAGGRFLGYTTVQATTRRSAVADVVMFDEQLDQIKVSIKGLKLKSAVAAVGDGGGFLPNHRNLCSKIVWKQDVDGSSLGNFMAWLDCLGHAIPAMRVLQLGGLSEIASSVIEALENGHETPRFGSFTLFDREDLIFSQLQQKYVATPVMQRLLWEPLQQVAMSSPYDLVIMKASQTQDLTAVGQVLSPGGYVVVQLEGVVDKTDKDSLRVIKRLADAGFRNAEKLDQSSGRHSYIVACSSKVPAKAIGGQHNITILLPEVLTPFLEKLHKSLLKCLTALPQITCTSGAVSAHPKFNPKTVYLSLLEAETPLIFDLVESQWETLHSLFRTKNLLWVTAGAQMSDINPLMAASIGLMRTIRSEDDQKRLVSVDIDPRTNNDMVSTSKALCDILEANFILSTIAKESEYVIRDGKRFIPRLMTLPAVNSLIEKEAHVPERLEEFPLWQQGDHVKLAPKSVGSRLGLYFTKEDITTRPLKETEIRVRVHQSHLLPRDMDALRGNGSEIGSDAVGTILEVGSKVSSSFKVNDQVMVFARGTISSTVTADQKFVWSRAATSPPHGSFSPTAFISAAYGLVISGRLRRGNTVLVHAAASAYGQAAVCIAKAKGASVIAAVSSPEQRKVVQALGITDDCIVDGQDDAFVGPVGRLTRGRGVDVVFGPASRSFVANFRSCAEFGRISQLASDTLELPSMDQAILKNLTLETFDISKLVEKQPWVVDEAINEVNALFQDSDSACRIQPMISHDLESLATIAADPTTDPWLGLHAVDTKEDTRVMMPVNLTKPLQLNSNGTYLLVGGLGGIGRSIAQLMVERGARHLAFLSRSGAKSKAATDLISSLQLKGVHIQDLKVDICDENQMRDAILSVQHNMPPIKGAVQCAAVLEDSIFDKMTYAKWTKAFRPKAIGSWNLHNTLPDTLDFLVFLSSSAGVLGNRGQANYAAGNTFQDALAHHRASLGRHSVSLDLGLVLGAGVVAENERLLDMMLASGFFGVALRHVHLVLERAMASLPRAAGPDHLLRLPTQVVTQMGSGGLVLQDRPVDPFWTRSPLFRFLNQVDLPAGTVDFFATGAAQDVVGDDRLHGRTGSKGSNSSTSTSNAGQDLRAAIRRASSPEKAASIAVGAVTRALARFMGVGLGSSSSSAAGSRPTTAAGSASTSFASTPVSTSFSSGVAAPAAMPLPRATRGGLLDPSRSTVSYGVDSLVKLNITRWIVDQSGVAVGDVDEFPSINELGAKVAELVLADSDGETN